MAPPPAWRPPIAVPALLIDLGRRSGGPCLCVLGLGPAFLKEEVQVLRRLRPSKTTAGTLDRDPRENAETDLEAERAGERLVRVAIPGESPRSEAREGLFKSLGELLMLMDDAGATYAIALPATHQLIGLLQRLPAWVRGQLSLRVFLVRLAESGRFEVGVLRHPSRLRPE